MTGPSSAVGRWFSRFLSTGVLVGDSTDNPERMENGRWMASLAILGFGLMFANPFQLYPLVLLSFIPLLSGVTPAAAAWSSVVAWAFIITPSFAGKGFAFFAAVIPVLAGSGSGRWLRRYTDLLRIFPIIITPLLLLSLAQWFGKSPSPPGWFSGSERSFALTRVTGVYGNPNLYAGVLLFVLPVGLAAAYSAKRPIWRWAAIGWLVLGLVSLILTFSYGAWIAGLAELFLWLRMGTGRNHRWGHPALFWCMIGLGVLLAGSHLGETALYRCRIWQGALLGAIERPLGWGPGGFHRYYPALPGAVPADHAHNLLLQTFFEEGIPGLGVLTVVTVNVFRKIGRSGVDRWRMGITVALVGQVILGLTDYPWATPLLAGLFWMGEAITASDGTDTP